MQGKVSKEGEGGDCGFGGGGDCGFGGGGNCGFGQGLHGSYRVRI